MISLRSYNREIEQLIDNGQYDESIAHCKYILIKFPKCIETYRNLGKTLLEQKKYTEALDIFSRVLTAFPDDFISHVGFSIIYEDQNNLNLSIWHMEQAFDVQPSNLAIQDELKRLFSLRDGEKPIKIRLTRGALVRMYARGELFQQAITEINSILQEDPRRIDLEVILARMHYLSGSITEAASTCSQIIERIPFCFEANQILQQIYINNQDIEGSIIFKNRLINLDPYYQFLESPFDDQEVPENKILLEKLVYSPTLQMDSQIPAWTTSDTDQWNSANSENIDWLHDLSDQNNTKSSAFIPVKNDSTVNNFQDSNVTSHIKDQIPGWLESSTSKDIYNFEFSANNDHIEKASDTNQNQMVESEMLDLTQLNDSSSKMSQAPADKDQITSSIVEPEIRSNISNADLASLFSELKEGKMNDENQDAKAEKNEAFPPPDWMSQFSASDRKESDDSQSQDIPDWLKNFDIEDQTSKNDATDMPDWLRTLQAETETDSQMESSNPSTVSETKTDISENIDQSDELNKGWEKIDLSQSSAGDSTLVDQTIINSNETQPPASDDTIPEWVKSVLLSNNPEDNSTSVPQTGPLDKEQTETIETSQKSIESSTIQEDAGIISQQTNDELLDWLRGLKNEEGTNQSVSSVSNSADSEKDFGETDRLKEFSQETNTKPVEMVEQPLFDQVPSTILQSKNNLPDVTVDTIQNAHQVLPSDEEVPTTEHKDINWFENTPIQKDTIETVNEATDSRENDANLEELIKKKLYSEIPSVVSKQISKGNNIDQLIQLLYSSVSDAEKDFAYWQCIGDVLASQNKLSDALSAYQKAEEQLIKSISV